jgi:hypothetical protein
MLRECLVVVLISLCFSIYFTRPLAFELRNTLPELGDSRLNCYIQAWDTHALITHPRELFHTNMLYPTRKTLAGSENLLGNQLLFAPVYLLAGNPVLGHNLVILASFFLSALTMYLLLRSVALPWSAAAVGSFVYAFALPRIAQLGHMQLLSTQWTPLIVLFLFRYVLRKRMLDLALMTGVLVLQVLCSLYLGYIAVLVVISYLSAALCLDWRSITRKSCLGLTVAGIAAMLLLSPIMHPYIVLKREGVIPQRAPSSAGSASPIASYLNVGVFTHQVYYPLLHRFSSHEMDGEKRLFVGFVPLALAAIGAFSFKESTKNLSQGKPIPGCGNVETRKLQSFLVLGSLFTSISAYVLTLGPELRIYDSPTHVRLPFFLVGHWIPGMSAFRVPARFIFAFVFGLAALAGCGYARVCRCRRLKTWSRALLFLLVISLMTIEYDVGPLHLASVMAPPHIAPEYQWLAAQPANSVVVELPIHAPGGSPNPYEEAGYLYASAYHWQPLINGYTGYRAPVTWETFNLAIELPSRKSIDLLGGLGVKYIVLHKARMSKEDIYGWQSPPDGLQVVAEFPDGTTILKIAHSRCRADLPAIVHKAMGVQQASTCVPPR